MKLIIIQVQGQMNSEELHNQEISLNGYYQPQTVSGHEYQARGNSTLQLYKRMKPCT